MKFVIKDWTGTELFQSSKFNSFDEAWEYIYERDPEPDQGVDVANWYSDYEVVEVGAK